MKSRKHDIQKKTVALLKNKAHAAYQDEPPVTGLTATLSHRSYFESLVESGASKPEIDAAWHSYYNNLSDEEKHDVWREYYDMKKTPSEVLAEKDTPTKQATYSDVKKDLLSRVHQRAKPHYKTHGKPLAYALCAGAAALLINFNQLAAAPIKAYISPGSVTSTPVIVGGNNEGVGTEQKIIIPKINVDVPIVFDEPSVEERKVQAALERGVVHYADTPAPGVPGNVVLIGHSSNNLLNAGKYKFAFILLNKLEVNDTFEIHYTGTRYVYRVYDRRIVKPTDVSVLSTASEPYTVTLITCDPPGTAVNRLVVQAEQISPEPAQIQAGQLPTAESTPAPNQVPGNAPSFFQRVRDAIFH